ncbi:MAG: GDSL-type esterase/lipase family protein, partial [Hypericibacter sp.]
MAAEPLRILAFGDSLTSGFGLPDADSFPSQLERALIASGENVKLINGGVAGDTSAGGLARLDWTLADKPDLVLLEFGANDGLR